MAANSDSELAKLEDSLHEIQNNAVKAMRDFEACQILDVGYQADSQ
jgi:hypothetical protein